MPVLTKRALMTPLLSAALPNHISSADRMQRRNGLHAIILALKPCITRFLHSAWIVLAGFADGMPIQIRVMPDCIVIPHNTRELYGCAAELSVAYVNRQKIELWLEGFPGALNDTGDLPVYRRGDGHCG
ncbi:SymE family type I addiction module toxin [Cronobacter turicensis]